MNDLAVSVSVTCLIGVFVWLHIWPYLQRRRWMHADFSYAHRFTITNTSVEITTSLAHKELGNFSPKVYRIKVPGIGWRLAQWTRFDWGSTRSYRFDFVKPLNGSKDERESAAKNPVYGALSTAMEKQNREH